MKRAMMVVMLMGMAGVAGAYEIKGNPDSKMSIGFNYDKSDMKGDYDWSGRPNFGNDFGNLTQVNYKGDIKVPVFSFMTLSAGGGYSATSLGLGLLDKDERWNFQGYNFSAGIRFFIP